jgi:glycosyltransferase involved in cell wall biosynthesis
MKVSIVMPVYNREAYFAETMDSILAQTYKDFEVIVVDDGSTDSISFLYDYYTAKDKRVKVIYTKHQGIAGARNTGIQESQGQYVAVMDSDDLMHPDRLKKQLKAIKNADFVYSSYFMGDEHAQIMAIHYPPSKVTLDDIKANGSWPHVTILADKVCFLENPYRDYAVNDDAFLVWDWFKAGYKGKLVKEPLVIVRGHKGSVSATKKAEIAKTQEILNKEYDESIRNS